MSPIISAYISTYKLWKGDDLEVRKRFRNKKRVAYGIRVFISDKEIAAKGWVEGTQRVYAQAVALDCIITAIETEDYLDARIELILRSEYLRQRLDMVLARLLKKKKGQTLEPMKEDEELWEHVANGWTSFGKGLRPDTSEAEQAVLTAIENDLRELFYQNPSSLESSLLSRPDIELT